MTFDNLGQTLVLVIVAYAVWQVSYSRIRLPASYRRAGFDRQRGRAHAESLVLHNGDQESVLLSRLTNWHPTARRPESSWYGVLDGYPCWQYLSSVRRSHSFLRRKSLKRARYNVTVIQLSEHCDPAFYFCIRSRQSLDSVDYLYAESAHLPDADESFTRLFYINTNNTARFEASFGLPLQRLFIDSQELSLELVNGFLILLRTSHLLDLHAHLQTERETAGLIAGYLDPQSHNELSE